MVAAWKSMGRRSSKTMAPLRTLRSISQDDADGELDGHHRLGDDDCR
jgi:hypothetical protein